MIFSLIQELLNYGLKNNLINKFEEIYSRNLLMECLKIDVWEKQNLTKIRDIDTILCNISNWAIKQNLIGNSSSEQDIFTTKIINCIIPRPNEVIKKFYADFNLSPKIATYNYYEFSKNTNYIKTESIKKNIAWISDTDYGAMEITINLSKPEKDPKDIEKEKNAVNLLYPKCVLCLENLGYNGRANYPARQNHRVIPITLTSENWYFQFSPYVYYNEHSIIFCETHRNMKIEENSFKRLLDFVDMFPHYFIGSNADLPIVGGSILSHDHYQAGNHIFPMDKAKIKFSFNIPNFKDVQFEILDWPVSVIRLTSLNKQNIISATNYIFQKWKTYDDESLEILSHTKNIEHNTITPIARKIGDNYILNLALRNNRTTAKYPLGIFHPHKEVHNIKKENIGLIEVMGLAILPGRLDKEMLILEDILKKENWEIELKNNIYTNKHYDWILNIIRNNNIPIAQFTQSILRMEIGKTFSKVLEYSGVFKNNPDGLNGFKRFINTL